MPESATIEHVGERSVQFRTTGADKQQCIVMLSVTANSHRLPPFIIFRRKLLSEVKFLPGIIVRIQERGLLFS
jgi:hypothetical protein